MATSLAWNEVAALWTYSLSGQCHTVPSLLLLLHFQSEWPQIWVLRQCLDMFSCPTWYVGGSPLCGYEGVMPTKSRQQTAFTWQCRTHGRVAGNRINQEPSSSSSTIPSKPFTFQKAGGTFCRSHTTPSTSQLLDCSSWLRLCEEATIIGCVEYAR